MEYLGAWGTLIHEKKLRSKISCQTPFKFIWQRMSFTMVAAYIHLLLTS